MFGPSLFKIEKSFYIFRDYLYFWPGYVVVVAFLMYIYTLLAWWTIFWRVLSQNMKYS